MKTAEERPTVIFLDYFETLEKVRPFLRKICAKLKCKPIVISSDFDTAPLAIFSDLKIIYFDDLLSREDYESMDKYVFNLTQTWYSGLKSIEGITEYSGIKFGIVVEERVQRFSSSVIKKLEIVLKIIESFHPHRIILIGDADIFQNLSIFIKEELNVPAVFIRVGNSEDFIKVIIKKLCQCIQKVITTICDNLMQKFVIRKRRNNGIFIDARLYFELRDLNKEFYPYLYLIEKGIRIRLRLIINEGLFFAPILIEDFLKISNIFSPFYRYWKLIKADTEFQDNLRYKNLPIWRVLERFIRELIIYDYSRVKKNIILLQKLYKALEPKLIVLREGVREPERTIILIAKQARVPTLVIQHGILAARNVYTKLLSDKIAVWGRSSRDWYGAYGNDTSKCIVTGRLNHDLIYLRKNFYEDKSEDCFLKIGADPNIETMLYIANFFKDVRYQLSVYESQDFEYIALNAILNAARCFPEKQLVIKIHPFDIMSPQELSNRITRYPNVFIVKNIDIIPLIINSSLVFTSRFSSATIDAVILNKPIISLNFYKRDDLIPFAQHGVALSVTKPEQLYQAVRQIFEDKKTRDWLASNRESFIYDYAYKIDGKSKERISDLIRSLYNESNPIILKNN